MKVKLLRIVLTVLVLGTAAGASAVPARAESVLEFTHRIELAYKAPNVRAALWDLFYTAGLDRASYFILLDTIDKMMLLHDPVLAVAEPLPKNEQVNETRDGYVYYQNMEPVGAVNVTNKYQRKSAYVIRQYFGRIDGIYFLTATLRKELPPVVEIPKDNWFYRRDRGQHAARPANTAPAPATAKP